MSLSAQEAAVAFRRSALVRSADPLANARLIPKQREFIAAASGCTESALRAANKLGKSTVAAMLFVALLRGMREFAGVKLPLLRRDPAPEAWALTRTYKQQVQGTQAAFRLALGNWPHRIAWQDRSEGTWAGVRIKPERWGSDDPETWAWLAFVSQQNSRNDADAAKGARLDAVLFDEPGYPAVVRELRKAGRPGQPFRMVHAFTPILRDEWEPIRQDIETPALGIREVTASLYDAIRGRVENGFLSEAEVAELEAKYSTDPHRDARLFGHYCDMAGTSPWPGRALQTLNRWLNESREPAEIRKYQLRGEKDTAEGRGLVTEAAELEVWYPPERDEDYLVIADAAEGIDDGQHDPLALIVVATRKPRLVACHSSYVSPHGLGNLAGQVAREYNGALVDPETQGGWGAPFLTGLRAARYTRVGHDIEPTSPGKHRSVLGFKTTDQTRPLYFSALRQAMLEDAIEVPSRRVIAQLLAVELDKHGKPLAGYGQHDEFVICLGRALYRLANLRAYRPAPRPPSMTDVIDRTIGKKRQREVMRRPNWIST